ncbi:sugar phosphate isomerase/epimerase [Variovorax sp. dw_954]|uniref:sugar phosphate isomerase/epimerase family protein n=1 Tax=Variovorax sp. dw_954 TaxID=2720078 RepID=UPI001BD54313|nr:sugar phosphate isomerase/epimerase [Variovorax sp. dw_954]
MTRPISLAALTVLELTPPEMVTCAADAGYSHVGIRLLPATPTEPQYDIVGDTPLLREVEARLADTGIKVLDVEIFRIKPDAPVAQYEAAIATAARLGASELLVAGNDPDDARQVASFAAFCELADSYGLGAVLEFMPWTEARNLAQAARIVERCGSRNAGVLIDAFHFSRSRSRIEDIASVPPSRLRYLQLCDAPAAIPATMEEILDQARAERLFPGDGGIDLVGLLRAVPRDIPLSLEIPMHTLARTVGATERARRALAATRRVLAQLDA